MVRSRLLAIAPLSVVAALALAACSPASDGDKGDDRPESPLSAYLSSIWGGDLSTEEQEARYTEQQKKSEELVAQCMSEEGFDYTPNIQSVSFSSGNDIEWKPDDRDWVTQYGYGMVNYPGRDEPPTDQQEYVDPNQDYVSSLSESEQTAFYEALYGPSPTEEELNEDGSYEYDWTKAGCQGWAQHESGANPMMDEEFESINDAINDFYTKMAEDPGFAKIDADWASCMADAGHSGFAKQADAQTSISDKLNEYYNGQTAYVEDDPKLAALGEEEVALAIADLDCREKTNYRDEYEKVQFALEEQFIADNKADLDALKAAAEQAS